MKFLSLFVLWGSLLIGQSLTNLADAKSMVAAYYESKDHDSVLAVIRDSVLNQISGKKYSAADLVIFDVDETTLSNYSHIKEMDFGYVPSLWNDWVQLGTAVPIKPILELYSEFIKKGASVVFITGRNSDQYEATKNNLLNTGFTTFDTLIVKEKNIKYPTSGFYKDLKRKELTAKGYNIIYCIGDQWSDLWGEFTGIKIKLPNYLYHVE